jgi:hypothetical protein
MLNFDSLTKDPNLLKKLLIGSLFALTGFGMLPVLGWSLEALRRNLRETAPALPEWDNLGAYTLDGLKATGLYLIWFLPVILPILGLATAAIFLPQYFASEEDAVTALVILNFCLVGWGLVYGLLMGFLSIPALGLLAHESFQYALNPLNAWRILKANPGGFLLAWGLTTATSLLLSSLGMFLCFVGTYPAFVLTYGLMGQYYGFAYREALEKLT